MEHIIEITKLDHLGRGIGKINDKIVFVNKAIPGDIVKIKILKEHKSYLEGKIVSIVKNSKDRIEYICPYYDKCGGCCIANLDYSKQLLFKKEKVENILSKYCHINRDIVIVASTKQIKYRNKISFKVSEGLSFYSDNHELIRIDKCLLASDKMNDIITKINKDNLDKVKRVVIRENQDELMVIYDDVVAYGKDKLVERIDNMEFVIYPSAFFQINKEVTNKLYNKILEYSSLTKNDRVLDLYCGTGTIGIFLSRYCKSVLGIEINEDSIKSALVNKKINDIFNIDFICGDVAKVLENDNYDVVIVDPPRNGLDKKTKDMLNKISPKRIIYVSCDPMTLARDINDLGNYELKDITLYDMFPNTYHVECVSVLHRKSIEK